MRTFGARATLSSTPLRNQPIVATATALASRKMPPRSEEHTSELQSQSNLVCRLLLEKKKKMNVSSHTLRVDVFQSLSHSDNTCDTVDALILKTDNFLAPSYLYPFYITGHVVGVADNI